MNPLGAFEIIVNPILAGMKQAFKWRGAIYVSPAMYQLMKGATQKELTHLLHHLKLCDMDPKEHDAQWWADNWQIMSAQLDRERS